MGSYTTLKGCHFYYFLLLKLYFGNSTIKTLEIYYGSFINKSKDSTSQILLWKSIVFKDNNYKIPEKIYGRNNVPTRTTVYRILCHFEEKGTVADSPKPGPSCIVTTSKNIEAVRVSVSKSPSTSICRRSQELQISPNALWRIIHMDLHLFPYKIQLTQQLNLQDHSCRQEYAEQMLHLVNDSLDFHEKILMSDEAHFHLNGYVNKQHCWF